MKNKILYLIVIIFINTCNVNNSPKLFAFLPLSQAKTPAMINFNQPSSLVVNESGTSIQIQISLNKSPTADVVLNTINVSDTNEATLNKTSFTFTRDNWNTAQILIITGVDDFVVDGDKVYKLNFPKIVSDDKEFENLILSSLTLTTRDNDVPGFNVTPTSGLVTTESLASTTFTISLTSEPTANVIIPTISSSNTSEGNVSPTTLTFTSSNWNIPQTVTVTGVNDLLDDGNQTYTINSLPATSSDSTYTGLVAASVTVVNGDNEAGSGFTIGSVVGNTSEAGATVVFSVVLNTNPISSVTISPSSSNTTEATVSPASLTFTSANWNVPQNITVTGVDDFIQDGTIGYNIIVGNITGGNSNYNALANQTVALNNTDNDTAGYTINVSNGSLIVSDGGQITATISINLNSQPTADVVIPVSSSNLAEATVSVSSLTFTASNWNTIQTFTVTGVNDSIADGNQAISIILNSPTTTDLVYTALDPADQNGSSCDNDNGTAKISICRTNIVTTTSEGGASTSFYLVLNQAPSANVIIPVSSSNVAEGTVSAASITLDATNWNQLLPSNLITVTGVNDALYDGNIAYNIVFGAATSADAYFNGYVTPVYPTTNTDNEVYFVIGAISGATSETLTTATFTVRLATAPTVNVTIPVASLNTAEGTVSPASLVFTNVNWNTNQTVTVTGVNDNVADGNQTYAIDLGLAVSGDARFNAQDPVDVNVTNNDAGEKRTFITQNTYDGNLGGKVGADAKCNADPNRPGILPNVYKAALTVNTSRTASPALDWAFGISTQYFRSNGTTSIGTTTAARIFTFALTNSFGTTEEVWTGLTTTWTIDANRCSEWTNATNSFQGRTGDMGATSNNSIRNNNFNCDLVKKILCVQQ